MEQFADLHQKWRKRLNNAALVIACFTLLLEIIVSYLMLNYLPDMIALPTDKFVIFYIILPSTSYFLLVLLGRYIMNVRGLSDTAKNYFSIFIITCQIFIIACTHNVFIFTSILYIVPIILTVVYSNKIMTNVVTIISIGLLIINTFVAIMDAQTNDIFHTIEVFIALILLLGCTLITNLLIDIERDKNNIIKYSALKQLQLEELIKCDPLTGLYNIASFYNSLDTAIKKNELPLSLAVIDVDNFKSVNDAWGHEKANEVLIYIAAQLQYCCSTLGNVYRYGGEEFTIVFPRTSPTHAKKMIETAQKNIFNHTFDNTPEINITFSCGIAAYPSADFNTHDFFQLADKIMYQAKFSGKNKILIGTPASSAVESI